MKITGEDERVLARRRHPSRHGARHRAFLPFVLLFLLGCGGGTAENAPAEGSSEARAEAPAYSPADSSAEATTDEARNRIDDEAAVILVTGSTDGLGRALALELVSDGAHLIIHGRDEERGAEVVAAIEAEGSGSAHFLSADFASLEEVLGLAERILGDYDRLDILVNNAGVGPGAPGHERVITSDGNELRFQVNYLAGYLLTRKLLPLLEASAPARIVNVSSRSQQPLDFDDLRMDRGYTGGRAYGRSKLAQVLMTLDLAEELAGSGVKVVAVHPAPAMDTELVRETGGTPQSSVARGVASVLQAIRNEADSSGTFFFELEARRAHEQAYDPEARRRLREISDSLVTEALGAEALGTEAREDTEDDVDSDP